MHRPFTVLILLIGLTLSCCNNLSGTSSPSATSGNDSSSTTDTTVNPRKATIVFAGDAMQHSSQLEAAHRPDGTYDYSGYFTEVEPYIKSADYAVVNLETTLAGGNYKGYPCFSSPDSYARELRQAGFDMFLTANNHCLDTRDAGAGRTLDVLDEMGVDHLGTYRNRAERASRLPMIKDINGIKVGFLNYTYGTNGIRVQKDIVVDYIDTTLIRNDIKALRKAGAEILCVNMHWGVEYKLLPVPAETGLASFLTRQGVDLIIGGHPHVIQPLKLETSPVTGRPRLVVYSMGNFISGMKKTDTQGGIMVKATMGRGKDGAARVESAEYLPVFVMRPGMKGTRNFRLAVADNEPAAKEFLKSATAIFEKHNINVPRSKELR